MKQSRIKLYTKWALSVCGIVVASSLLNDTAYAANTTTCYLERGFNIYNIKKNGSLGKRDYSIGTTRNAEYECITDRYYNRIKVNGKWRYVSVKAVSSKPAPSDAKSNIHDVIEETDSDDDGTEPSSRVRLKLSKSLALNDNYLIRDASGKTIASSFGVNINKQNVQIKLSENGEPTINEEGYVNVQYNYINSKGRSQTSEAWVVKGAIINYDETIAAAKARSSESGTNGSGTSGDNKGPDNSFTIENVNAPKAGEQIYILDGINNLVPKSEPFLVAEPVDGVKPLSPESEIIATGNRSCDADSKRCFVEIEFSDDTDGDFVGWIDDQQTSVNPSLHKATPRSSGGLVMGYDIIDNELGSSDGQETNSDPESWYNKRFTPEQQESHKQIAEFLKNLVPPTSYVTNRGLVRMHNNRRGFCGSYHYATEFNPTTGASDEIQTYANPTTACVIARLAQTWKKYHCTDGGSNNGCRLSTGDISHRTLRKFDGHSSHTDGQCIDIRPIRKSGVGPLDYNSSAYDVDKTRELIKVLKDLGGTNILFNDPALIKEGISKRAKGHHNHIHVCFKADNKKAKNSCESYRPDYEVCPELKSFFENSLMKDFRK